MIYKAHWGCGTLSNIQYDDDDIMLRQTQSPPAPALRRPSNNFIMEPCFIIITNRHWLPDAGTQTTDDQSIGHALSMHMAHIRWQKSPSLPVYQPLYDEADLWNQIHSWPHPPNWPGLRGKCGVTKGTEPSPPRGCVLIHFDCGWSVSVKYKTLWGWSEGGGHLTDLI